MNFEQLEYIVKVAYEKSISRAAEKLHISPSGISQSISQLEKELDITIFNRSRIGVTLTTEGQMVFDKAIDILNNLHELKEDLTTFKNLNKKHLKITCAPTFTYVLHNVLKKFSNDNIEVTFEIEEQNTVSLLRNFNKDKYDLAFLPSLKSELERENNLQYEFLYKGYNCVIVGKHSPLFSLDYVSAKDLLNQKVVMYSFSNKNFSEMAKRYKNDVILKSNRTLTLIEMIKESKIFTYVHDITIRDFPEVLNGELKIIPIKDPDFIYIDFWVIYSAKNTLSDSAKIFINEVKLQLNK